MSLKWEKIFLGYSTFKTFNPTSVTLPHFAGKKNHFSLQNHWTDSSLRSKILNSAKSCLFKLVCAKLLICLLKLILIDFCLLDLTIIPGNISDLKSRNLDNTQIFPSLNNQFQMGSWFESWLRRRSLNRKLIFSRSPLAWSKKWLNLTCLGSISKISDFRLSEKNEIVMEKKTNGRLYFWK